MYGSVTVHNVDGLARILDIEEAQFYPFSRELAVTFVDSVNSMRIARNLAARLEAENHEMLQALRAAQHMFDHSITGAAYQIIREAVATFGGQE